MTTFQIVWSTGIVFTFISIIVLSIINKQKIWKEPKDFVFIPLGCMLAWPVFWIHGILILIKNGKDIK